MPCSARRPRRPAPQLAQRSGCAQEDAVEPIHHRGRLLLGFRVREGESLCENGDRTPKITGPVPVFAQTLSGSPCFVSRFRRRTVLRARCLFPPTVRSRSRTLHISRLGNCVDPGPSPDSGFARPPLDIPVRLAMVSAAFSESSRPQFLPDRGRSGAVACWFGAILPRRPRRVAAGLRGQGDSSAGHDAGPLSGTALSSQPAPPRQGASARRRAGPRRSADGTGGHGPWRS
jgi:hypothetical protein